MNTRSGAVGLLVAVAVLAPAVAQAKPVSVNVRVEGIRTTLFEGRLTTDVHTVDSSDGTGPHKCDGTNGGASETPAPTLLGAFDTAIHDAGLTWQGDYFADFEDFGINRVGPDSSDTKNNRYWGQVLNFKDTQVGGCQQQVKAGDQVLVAFNSFGHPKLRLTAPRQARVNRPVQLTVVNGETGKPFAGALVRGKTTGPQGHVTVTFSKAGTRRFKARARDAIRSNQAQVQVNAG
ncbi:MAG TPA: hypothetical protein VJT75_03995 [Thermoleophilaceae bacterium]|nr:hypothetical protein [Thermoleophilaceae bacterium]